MSESAVYTRAQMICSATTRAHAASAPVLSQQQQQARTRGAPYVA
jgi:hypothetical protein